MVIVMAILGIFLAITVPSFEGYAHKARQSEARILLGNMYTAQRSYYLQFGHYSTSLTEIGWSATGNLRYIVGFAPERGNISDSFDLCNSEHGCKMLVPHFRNKGYVSGNDYQAHAIGHIGGMIADEWTMNQDKILSNTVSGL